MDFLKTFKNFELLTESKRYDHINFIPPKTVSNQSKKGLKYRMEYSPKKDELSVRIAKKLIRRDKITQFRILQMCTFFNRHKRRTVLDKFKKEPWKDKTYVQFLLWGGESGRAWSERIRTQIKKVDNKNK